MTTILVVDDEPLIAMALEAVLEDAGYRVMTAGDGRHGLERLADTPADLVLLDMMMPVMNGPTMLAAMAADPRFRGIPVIILSSLPKETTRARVDRVADVLGKPCTAEDVLEAVARALGTTREPAM